MQSSILRNIFRPISKRTRCSALALFIAAILICPEEVFSQDKINYDVLSTGRIAFTRTKNNNSDIYVIDFDSRTTTPLVTTPNNEEYPRWSPDGSRLVFQAGAKGSRDIFSVASDGSDLQQLTTHPADDKFPEWSPDGTKIVFATSRGIEGSTLAIMNADGTELRKLPISRSRKNALHLSPKWSPRGNEIVFSSDDFVDSDRFGVDLFLYNTFSNSVTRLSKGRDLYFRPAWNRLGNSIVFTHGAGKAGRDLWVIKKGSKTPEPITRLEGREQDAEWIEDDKKILFVNGDPKSSPVKNFHLYLIDLSSGKKIFQITEGDFQVRDPSYTPFPPLPPKPLEMIQTEASETGDTRPVITN